MKWKVRNKLHYNIRMHVSHIIKVVVVVVDSIRGEGLEELGKL